MRLAAVLISALVSIAVSVPAAGEARIAVAANFTAPMKAIIAAFEAESGHEVAVSYGSTGMLYTQIRNGAPFDALLAADSARPLRLEEEGAAVPGTRFTYAVGSLVLWSAEPGRVEDGPGLLRSGDFARLSIANPKLAPYDAAAVQTLNALGVADALASKLVRGENIAQAHQFVDTGNAEVGLVALSQVMEGGRIREGSGWVVPADLHEPIRQDAVILNRGRDNPALCALFAFLRGEEARAIISDFGYQSEESTLSALIPRK